MLRLCHEIENSLHLKRKQRERQQKKILSKKDLKFVSGVSWPFLLLFLSVIVLSLLIPEVSNPILTLPELIRISV
jgi:hypothetical protein